MSGAAPTGYRGAGDPCCTARCGAIGDPVVSASESLVRPAACSRTWYVPDRTTQREPPRGCHLPCGPASPLNSASR